MMHPSQTNRSQPTSAQVVVVGAGVSGLQTAHKLQQSGISCLVLEASGTIGGQGFAHGNSFDLESHPRTHALATENGLLEEQPQNLGKAMLEGFDAFEHDGQPVVSVSNNTIPIATRQYH